MSLRFIVPLTLIVFFLSSCGHTIVREKGLYQRQILSVDVPVFLNRSLEPQVSQFFTEAFTRELMMSGLFEVNAEGASTTLQGIIATVSTLPGTFQSTGLALEKNVSVTIVLNLSRKDGRPVKSWTLGDAEPYRVDQINVEDPTRREALKRIAARMGRRFSALALTALDRKPL